MEAFWNYFFWQSLSLNGYDDVSHILRISATASKCSTLETKMGDEANDEEVYRDCNSWLGPDQPGITTPDPTENTPLAASFRRRNEQPASRRGERRAAGEPDAGPLPGQPDISKPQVTVPDLGGLLKLPDLLDPQRPGRPGGPSDAPQSPEDVSELLDFLLGP